MNRPKRQTWRKTRRCLVLGLACLLVAPRLIGQGQMDEYSIKAWYLYNFTKYVVWPDDALRAGAFMICLAGDDPFDGKLDQAIAGRKSGDGRPLEVRRLRRTDRETLRGCDLLFLSKSENHHAAAIVNALRSSPVFTVADFESFAQVGGVADLRIEGTKVKVDLNMTAATRANLKVSGKLQQVAILVDEKR